MREDARPAARGHLTASRPGPAGRPGPASRPGPSRRGLRIPRAAGAIGAAAATALLAGCAQAARAATPIQIGPAYVTQPGPARSTSAFLIIQNNTSTSDRLLSARTSVGGRVELLGPGSGGSGIRVVAAIPIPADRMVRLRPNSYQLLIIGPGRMKSGHQIMLTLIFARAGAIRVAASVTDPQSGGSSYFLS